MHQHIPSKMCRQFGITVIKGVIVLANLCLSVISFVLLLKCGVIYGQVKSYEYILDTRMQTIPLVAEIFALAVFLFTIFGFVGIWLNAFGMMCFFVMIMFVLAGAITIFGFVVLGEVKEMVVDQHYFTNRLNQDISIRHDPIRMSSANAMQSDLMCCGFATGEAYNFYDRNFPLPRSCCKDPSRACIGEGIWEATCLQMMTFFGITTYVELGTMLLAVAGHCAITGGIAYAFSMAVRQYYYY